MKTKLLFLLIACCNSYFSSAQITTTIDNQGVTYEIIDGTSNAKVTEVDNNGSRTCPTTANIVIPNSVVIDGTTYSVTVIGENSFNECQIITSVSLPNSITHLQNHCFYSTTNLSSINIPNSVTSIGESAINFTKITSLVIPSSVTFMGGDCISYNSLLNSLTFEGATPPTFERVISFFPAIDVSSSDYCELIVPKTATGDNYTSIDNFGAFTSTTVANMFGSLSAGTNWGTAADWSSGSLPTATDDVRINNGKTISIAGAAACKNLILGENATLETTSAGKLTIEGNLTQNGTFNISSDNGSHGTLIIKGTHAETTGKITYKKYFSTAPAAADGWHIISSPVQNKAISDLYPMVEAGSTVTTKRALGVYKNDNAENAKWVYFDTTTNPTPGNFVSGKGYAIKKKNSDGAGTLDFDGYLNTDDAGVSFGLTTTGDKYTAIGNSYTAFVDNDTFLNSLATTTLSEKTIWVWNSTCKKYETKNLTSSYKIAPGEAFFVNAKAAEDITFSEANQEHETSTGNRQVVSPTVKLFLSNTSTTEQATIFYLENTTTGFDNGYDSSMFTGFENPFAIYTQLVANNDGKNLAIQSLPNNNYKTTVIPVGVNAAADKEIIFYAEGINLPNDANVILEDRENNTFTSLNQNEVYKVTPTSALNGIGRFYLHTNNNAAIGVANFNSENVSIYKTNASTLRIVGLEQGTTAVKLFNVLGKQVISTSFESNGVQDISLPQVAAGVYIVEVQSNTGKLSKKIILE